MKIAVATAVVLAGISAAVRWSAAGAPVRRRWSTVVRMERPR
jgi:hypothetical protein